MKRLFAILVLMLFSSIVFSAKVVSVKGSVDVMIKGKWRKAKKGMKIKDGTKIMTGLSSSLKVKTTGGYFIVKELSMVTFHEKKSKKSHRQKLALKIGKVRVRFKKVKGIKSSFGVQTLRGTASVRGTEEIVSFFPMSGMQVNVIEGGIDVIDFAGRRILARAGEVAGIDNQNNMVDTANRLVRRLGLLERFGDNDINGETVNKVVNDIIREGSKIIEELIGEPERL